MCSIAAPSVGFIVKIGMHLAGRRTYLAITFSLLMVGGVTVHASAATTDDPPAASKDSSKNAAKPSPFSQLHNALKGLDKKIPAETSKAAKETKSGFKKRFKTTSEEGKK